MSDYWAPLEGQKYISLETFKKSGQGVKTPIWFARDGDSLVFFTRQDTWKVKRLRRNAEVKLAACNGRGTVHGEWMDATGHRLDGEAGQNAHRLLAKKYLLLRLTNPFTRLFGGAKKRVYYRIDSPQPVD